MNFLLLPGRRKEEGGSGDSSAMQIQTPGPIQAAPSRLRRGFVREFIRTSTNTGKLAARGSRFTGKAMNEDSSI